MADGRITGRQYGRMKREKGGDRNVEKLIVYINIACFFFFFSIAATGLRVQSAR